MPRNCVKRASQHRSRLATPSHQTNNVPGGWPFDVVLCALTLLCLACVRRGRHVEHESIGGRYFNKFHCLRWRFFATCVSFKSSIFAWPRRSPKLRLSIAACAKHRVSLIELSPVRLVLASAAVVRLVIWRRCRNQRHACFRSSRGAADVTKRKSVAFENCGSKFFWWSSWEVSAFSRGKVAGGGVWRAQDMRDLRQVGSPTGARSWTACAPVRAVVAKGALEAALYQLNRSTLLGGRGRG